MPRKTKIIYAVVFIIVGALMLGVYYTYVLKKPNSTASSSSNSGYQAFNPFGSATTNTTTGSSPTNTSTGSQEIIVPPGTNTSAAATGPFHQLTTFAVAGATFFQDTRPIPQVESSQLTATPTKTTAPTVETVPALRYVERMTGHIDEMYLDDSTVSTVSNSTVPSIYEALFDSKASTVIYRYLENDDKTITSFMATLGASQGEFLPSNITDISVSPDQTKFFYITENAGTVTGTIRAFSQTKKTQVFSSPFTEWLSQWAGLTKIYLTTKASSGTDGYLFSLNTATGTLSKVFGPVQGLTTLSNNTGTSVLYSSTQSTGPKLSILNPTAHTSLDTPYSTLPEKCVWSQDNINAYCAVPDAINDSPYPDAWYQGSVSFNDQFVKINTQNDDTSVIADSSSGTPVDGTDLFLNNDESELFFINKKDGTLWELDLKQPLATNN